MRFFISLCLCSLPLLLSARTEISFSPLDPICSTDMLTCDAIVDYLFTLASADSNNLIITHQLSQNGSAPAADPFGQILGTYPNYYISGIYPIGDYQINLAVEDALGNIMTAQLSFEVVDCVAPILNCLNGLIVEIQAINPEMDVDGDGDLDYAGVLVYASDLVDTVSRFCEDSLRLSINKSGEPVQINQEFLFLGCFGQGTLVVEIYAWDFASNPYAIQPDGSIGGPNYNYCETFILVLDNDDLCNYPPQSYIVGTIRTEENNPVANVEVAITGQINESYITAADGQYETTSIELFYDYTITPNKDVNPVNGVTAFDLVLIQKHILGIINLGNPYKLIAADVNDSGSVTTLDLITIRRLILNLDQDFTQVASWRFVDANFDFPDPENPWLTPFPEYININDLNNNALDLDFIAIKMGDINASANSLE